VQTSDTVLQVGCHCSAWAELCAHTSAMCKHAQMHLMCNYCVAGGVWDTMVLALQLRCRQGQHDTAWHHYFTTNLSDVDAMLKCTNNTRH
jgi:hypothetical protein